MKNKQAFTLIELLVVVLIIGILAAVALPQYQKAIAKARVIRLFPLMRAIDSAEQIYKLNNGTYVADFSVLDVDMPVGGTVVNDGFVSYQNFLCHFQGGGYLAASLYCASSLVPGVKLEKYFSDGVLLCWSDNTVLANSVCSSLANSHAFEVRPSGMHYYRVPFN